MKWLVIAAFVPVLSVAAVAAEKFTAPPVNEALKPVNHAGLEWQVDLAAALKKASADKKLIFIDFSGETCTNCRINEKAIFVKPEVQDLFKQYVCVQLFTDVIPAGFYAKPPAEDKREQDAEVNFKFQKTIFNSEQLPLYAVVRPAADGQFEIVGKYDEGRINHLDKFLEFLKSPLK